MFGGIGMFLFWGVIIILAVLMAWIFIGGPRTRSASRSTALDILRERYAKGEIDKDEYEQRRRTLTE